MKEHWYTRVPTSTLTVEVEPLDAARITCRAGVYDEAIRLVARDHREYGHGVLAPDADVVALEAREIAAKSPSEPQRCAVLRLS